MLATVMGVCSGGLWPPWISIHGADKVEKGSMVLFFSLVFSVALPTPLGIFLPTPFWLQFAHHICCGGGKYVCYLCMLFMLFML